MVKYLLIFASLLINYKIVFGELVRNVRRLDLQLMLWNYFHFGSEDDIQFDNKLSAACARAQTNDKTGLLDYIAEVNNLILANGDTQHPSRGDRIVSRIDAILSSPRWYSLDDSVVHSIASNLPVCQSIKIRLDLIGGPISIDITRNVVIMDANEFYSPSVFGRWLIVAPIRKGYLFLRYFGLGGDPYRYYRGWITGFGNPSDGYIYSFDTKETLVEDLESYGKIHLQIKDFKARGANKELQKEAHRVVLKGLPKGYFDNVDARGEFLKKYGSFKPVKAEDSKSSRSKKEVVQKLRGDQSSPSRNTSSGSKFEKGKGSNSGHDAGIVSGIGNLSLVAGKKNGDRSRSPIGKEKASSSIMGNDKSLELPISGVRKNESPSRSGRFHK